MYKDVSLAIIVHAILGDNRQILPGDAAVSRSHYELSQFEVIAEDHMSVHQQRSIRQLDNTPRLDAGHSCEPRLRPCPALVIAEPDPDSGWTILMIVMIV